MSTYVHRIVQVKVSDKWETVKIYTGDTDNLKDINDYCDNLCGLRGELYRRFEDQPWDSDCPDKELDSYNHCWATELNNKFFKEMRNAYIENKLNEILAILKKESFCSEDEYYDKVNEIKEYYYYDFLTLISMINIAYTIAEQTHGIYNLNDIRILFYYD